jgi:hypothetical protein
MSIIDLPGAQGINICRKCGGILVSGECPECSVAAQADKMADAMAEAEKDEKARRRNTSLDVYKILENQARIIKRRQRQIDKMTRSYEQVLEEHADDPFMAEKIAKAMAMLDRSLLTLGNTLPKVAKEMLSFQTSRSKLVDEMSMDQQVAQIVRWFSKLPSARQLILLETMTSEYNRANTRRATAKALKKHRRESNVG